MKISDITANIMVPIAKVGQRWWHL